MNVDSPTTTARRRVLLLHTGGTLGMRGTPLEPAGYAANLASQVPEIAQLADLESRIVCNLDSSDLGPDQWTELALAITEARQRVDGFVVVHGTDTMAYTASALAYALEGLDRPVVLTGAQRPLAALRTDARRNLADAVELATRDIPEVGICFDGLLLRGCRATKSNAQAYRAFASPGCAPLARLGVDVAIGEVRRPTVPFRCDARFDARVLMLQVTPGLNPDVLAAVCGGGSPVKGVVLAAFGVGTVPTHTGRPLAPVVARLVETGVEVLVVTQAGGHVDLGLYANSRPLLDAGAISGGAMGVEAAVTKLMHALAIYGERAERRAYLERDVAGER